MILMSRAMRKLIKYRTKILRSLLIKPKIYFLKTLSEIKIGGNPVITQPALFNGKGKISFGKNVIIGWQYSKNFFSSYTYFEARNSNSEIKIGNNVQFNNSCSIVSESSSIKIGDDCLIGANCEFLNSDFHSLDPSMRRAANATASREIQIGKNVFFGNNVVVLKGVAIGDNSVIGSNSVVVSDVPESTIAAGNPAKVIRAI